MCVPERSTGAGASHKAVRARAADDAPAAACRRRSSPLRRTRGRHRDEEIAALDPSHQSTPRNLTALSPTLHFLSLRYWCERARLQRRARVPRLRLAPSSQRLDAIQSLDPKTDQTMTQAGGAAEEGAANGAEGRRESSGQPAQPPRPADDAANAPPPAAKKDLAAVYTQMHEAFKAGGADAWAISSLRRWYRIPTDADYRDNPAAAAASAAATTTTTTGRCFPRLYRDPPHSLGEHCTRLVFLRLSDDLRVREVAEEAAREVLRPMSLAEDERQQQADATTTSTTTIVPPDHYLVGPHELHVSVFHVSHPTSVCGCAVDPDPSRPTASSSGAEEAASPAPVLTPAEWQREGEACIRAVREVAARRPRACLVLERVAVARSGTLLLMWGEAEDWGEEEDGGVAAAPTPPPALSPVAELRAALRRALPGASPKQPDIIHTTVLRLLGRAGDGDPSLFYDEDEARGGGQQQRQRVVEVAERLTAKWRGQVRVPLFYAEDRLRLASEDRFGTVGPETQLLPVR